MVEQQIKTQEFRKNVAEQFVKALKEDPFVWRKGWSTLNTLPINAVKGTHYHGINRLYLYLASIDCGYTDPRFATFKQIQDKGWKLKDAKGTGLRVEYWFPWDRKNKTYCEWKEYREWCLNPTPDKDIIPLAKYYTVFNAKYIEGIPALPEPESRADIKMSRLIPVICKNMGIEILNDGENRAYYSIREDKIHVPEAERFKSQEDYDATRTHELSHATGAAHRLNRFENGLSSEAERAKEELIAEISSSFLSVHFQSPAAPMELSGEEMQNHIAYVQSWIEDIENKPEVLMEAIREAEKAANYIELKAEIITEKEFETVQTQSVTVDANNPEPIQKSLEDLLKRIGNGLTEDEILKMIQGNTWTLTFPIFDEKHHVVKCQSAVYTVGDWKAELHFHNTFDPRNTNLEGKEKVVTKISLWIHPVDTHDAERILQSKKTEVWGKESKSVRNAQKNYLALLETWKCLTNQEQILFAEKTPMAIKVPVAGMEVLM